MSIRESGSAAASSPGPQTVACQGFLVKHGGLIFKKVLENIYEYELFYFFRPDGLNLIRFSDSKAILHPYGKRVDMGKTVRLE